MKDGERRLTDRMASHPGVGQILTRLPEHLQQSGQRFNSGSMNSPTLMPRICSSVCRKAVPVFSPRATAHSPAKGCGHDQLADFKSIKDAVRLESALRRFAAMCGMKRRRPKAAFGDDFRRKLCRRPCAAATSTSNARRPIRLARVELERIMRATPARPTPPTIAVRPRWGACLRPAQPLLRSESQPLSPTTEFTMP